ncbi:MarR family winged helix-turn-helix transcriptional regulator [Nonomuraea sp. NPDC049714]|uniref:MarR family winged helix-turn-helix transcriptional regulator n=1 Tax=Nonomuraea sp. NPDC049714 TaxID=3364357 RepID=UPI00379AAAC6
MTELAAFLGLDKSTLSGLIDRAERRGLVARGKDPQDRRVVDVFLTRAGQELAEQVYVEVRHALAPATDRLNPQDRDRLVQLLHAVTHSPG